MKEKTKEWEVKKGKVEKSTIYASYFLVVLNWIICKSAPVCGGLLGF